MPDQLEVEWLDPDDLIDNPRNFRKHPPRQMAALEESLDKFGWVRPVLRNSRTGHVLNGHARIKHARERQELVPTVTIDVPESMEQDILLEFDRLAAMAETDTPGLVALLSYLQEATGELPPGYDQDELDRLTALLESDDTPEPPSVKPYVPFPLRVTMEQFARFEALVSLLARDEESVTGTVLRVVQGAAMEVLG